MAQSVKLMAMTQPEPDAAGPLSPEQWLAFIARISNPKNQINNATAPKLVKYLLDNKHFSPFEMINMVMQVETTRDIARQILRHGKAFGFQEFSQRYADPTDTLGFVVREARMQDPKNRQNSIPCEDQNTINTWRVIQLKAIEQTEIDYKWAIDHGIAKEQARVILPEGLTMSRLYLNGTLRSWIHYVAVRQANGTQKEHQQIAKMAKDVIINKFPALRETLNV